MKNRKKLSRDQLRTINGGDETDKLYGGGEAGCHCHGCAPSPSQPTGLPPADFYTPGSAQQCWTRCDSYRANCGK
ncbi:bacteriocin-like protein [Chryseobacterium taichungense]|uniref:bacteriocin-like protein n=1 Tax=Chryseobacterium taichungense TaxID=295069 RepID=UPI00406BDC3D